MTDEKKIYQQEIRKAIENLKKYNKAPGIDGILAALLKMGLDHLLTHLH